MVLWSRPTFAPMRRMDQPDSYSAITVATSVSVRGCRRIVASCSRSNRSTVPLPRLYWLVRLVDGVPAS